MMVGVLTANARGIRGDEIPDPLVGLEVILHPEKFTGPIHPLEGMRAEAVHVAKARRNAAVAEQNRELMGRFGTQREEVPDVVRFLNVGVRVAFLRVDKIREFKWIADK